MGILDNETIYKKYDPLNMQKNIDEFADQIETAWKETENVTLPTHYINAKNVVILGMGGSGIAGSLTKSYCLNKIKLSVEVIKDYTLPNYVDSNSLVIVVSYSGGTEEAIATFDKAGKLGAKLIAITCGGEIESLARKYDVPNYKISYQSPPRAAIGYLFIPVLYLLAKLQLIQLKQEEIAQIVQNLRDFQKKISTSNSTSHNDAKQLAEKIKNKYPIVVSSGILSPVGIRFKTQLNENSKSFASFEEMPEMCHNFLQGLDYPEKIKDKFLVIFLLSRFDNPRNVLRYQAVQSILRKKGVSYQLAELQYKGSELSEVLHYIHFVDYVSYYLAMLEQTDPSPYEMITYLKNYLAENK